jgi:hypothetical protein
MATTTNYGWTTPDDTALVKDGASAIRTLGSSIDTTLKTQIDAQIPDSLLTTTGDIIYASGASTPARLGIGSTGQVLQVSGGLPAWATAPSGGMTLLSTTSLSGASTTISSISQSYNLLYAIVYGVTSATANGELRLYPNAVTNNFDGNKLRSVSTSVGFDAAQYPSLSQGESILRTDANNSWAFSINNYTSTTNYKTFSNYGGYINGSSVSAVGANFGYIKTNSAITSLQFVQPNGNFSTGTVLLYGVK